MTDDIAILKELARNREALLRDCMKDRDALKAEIAAMRQQEPVAWMCADDSVLLKGYWRFSFACEGAWNIPVYLAPGAQPDHFEQDLDMVEARRIAREYAWSHTDIDSGNLYWALHVALRKIDSLKLAPYDQTSLELCEICGWRARIPGECCLMCRYQKMPNKLTPDGHYGPSHHYADGWNDAIDAMTEDKPAQRTPYNERQIAWELERTALGDGYYGNALRVAKDFACLNAEDRGVLDRYATGTQRGADHAALQDIALRIYAAAPEAKP